MLSSSFFFLCAHFAVSSKLFDIFVIIYLVFFFVVFVFFAVADFQVHDICGNIMAAEATAVPWPGPERVTGWLAASVCEPV